MFMGPREIQAYFSQLVPKLANPPCNQDTTLLHTITSSLQSFGKCSNSHSQHSEINCTLNHIGKCRLSHDHHMTITELSYDYHMGSAVELG